MKKVVIGVYFVIFSLLVMVSFNQYPEWMYKANEPVSQENLVIPINEEIEADYVVGRVLFKYVHPALSILKTEEDFSSAKIVSYKTLLLPNQDSLKNLSFKPQEVWYKGELEEGVTFEEAREELLNIPGVLMVEPDYTRTIDSDITTTEVVEDSDPLLDQQYYLNTVNIPGARDFLASHDINPGGDRSIVVAVIDTGVDYTHEDLATNMWVNTGEIAGDGIDNDNNGYIDDIYGASTVGNDYQHTGDPYDYHGHGTHVAGIIAADGNNNIGIQGVASNVRIMAVKASGSSGIFNTSDIVEAINYAAANGADVINMSFGGYAKSTIEMEALEIAFNTSVLVASAGNKFLPNYPEPVIGINMYPASYNFVIGVMSSGETNVLSPFSNYDYWPHDSNEYEVVAPGEDILSTLPNNQYAKWDGTSMSAPIVSGVAALLKSYFNDTSSHSSRFIMGQIIGTANNTITIIPGTRTAWPAFNGINALNAFESVPKPELMVFEHYIMDDLDVDDFNNDNGVIDAGETINLGIILRNHWGKADNVTMKIDALTPSGQSDPYITFITDTVDFGSVGTFNTDDNGLIFNEDKLITGLRNPFVFSIDPSTPNDYRIILNVTLTCTNGLDPDDPTTYVFATQKIVLTVRSGRALPSIIEEDMTLTNDTFWIIPNATLIPAGVTVNVEPGTQIQFWSNDPEDPYADLTIAYLKVEGTLNVNGTEDNPVRMFPSELKASYPVMLFQGTYENWYVWDGHRKSNTINISYAEIVNPNIGANTIDHSKFYQNYNYMTYRYLESGEVREVTYYGPTVRANYISNSIFKRLGATERRILWADDKFQIEGVLEGNLFDSCYMEPSASIATNNVFLNNFILESTQWGDRWYFTSSSYGIGNNISGENIFSDVQIARNSLTGTTYIKFNINMSSSEPPFTIADNFSKSIGGHLVDINSKEENDYLLSNFTVPFYIGMEFDSTEGYIWMSGEEVTYTNWSQNYQYNNSFKRVAVLWDHAWGVGFNNQPYSFIVEVPGEVLVEDIVINESEVYISEISEPYQLDFTLMPYTASTALLTFESENEAIVTVDANGVITPVSIGQTKVTVTNVDGTLVREFNIYVTEHVALTDFNILSVGDTLQVGSVRKIRIEYLPSNATDKALIYTSDNPSVLSVDQNGNITALTGGTAIISVSNPDGSIVKTTTYSVVQPVTNIKFNSDFIVSVLSEPGELLMPMIEPFNATDKTLVYESSDPDIAYIDEDGYLVKLAVGTVVIRARSASNDVYDDIIVNVVENPVNQDIPVDIAITSYSNQNHFFTLMDNGRVWRFGSSTTVPVIMQQENIVKIDGYKNSLIMMDESGKIYYQRYVQENISFSTITALSDVAEVYAGSEYFIALKTDGTVWGWGQNYNGQLGATGLGNWNLDLIQIEGLSNIVDVVLLDNTTYYLDSEGSVYILGYADGSIESEPKKLGVSEVTEIIREGWNSIYIRLSSGTIKTMNANGNTYDFSLVRNDIKSISVVENHTLVLLNDGQVIARGENSNGQLGIGTFVDQWNFNNSITKVTNFIQVVAGVGVSAGITNDGKVYVWGTNTNGELNNFSNDNQSVPNLAYFGLNANSNQLVLEATSPENASDYVSRTNPIIIDYDQMIMSSDNFGRITITDPDGKLISVNKELHLDKIYIYPVNELLGETLYQVNIPHNAVKSLFGSINTETSFSFTTEPGELYVKNIIINETEINISNNGISYQIDYVLEPHLVDNTFVIWSSNNEGIVTVDANGLLTPVSEGTATVTVTDIDGAITRNITVNVLPYVPLEDFEVTVTNVNLEAGDVYKVILNLLPTDTTEINMTWTSSNQAVAMVDKFGNITALAGGSATITINSPEGSITRTLTVNVTEQLSKIEFDQQYLNVGLNTPNNLIMPILYEETATNKEIAWMSSNPDVAYIDENGYLVKLDYGYTVLRAYSVNDETIYDEIVISVTEDSLENIKFKEVVVSASIYFGLTVDGNVIAWGDALPNGEFEKLPYENIIDIDAFYGSMIMVDSSSKIYYHMEHYGMLVFREIVAIPEVVEVAAGYQRFLALQSNGQVWAFGNTIYGETWTSNDEDFVPPVELVEANNIVDITSTGYNFYVLNASGEVYTYDVRTETLGQYLKVSTHSFNYIERSGRSSVLIGEADDGNFYTIKDTNELLFDTEDYDVKKVYFNSQYILLVLNDGTVVGKGVSMYIGEILGFYEEDFNYEIQGYTDYVEIPKYQGLEEFYLLGDCLFVIDSNGSLYFHGFNAMGANPIKKYFSNQTLVSFTENHNRLIELETSNPVDGFDVFAVEDIIVLDFNNAVIPGYSWSSLRLIDANGIFTTITKEIVLDKVYITPQSPLKPDMDYFIEIPSDALYTVFGMPNNYMRIDFTTIPQTLYVRDIVVNEDTIYISNNGLPYYIDFNLYPSVIDQTYVTWTSSNSGIASVDEYGVITPQGVGSARITVKSNDGLIEKYVDVYVSEYIPMTSLSFTEDEKVVFVGDVIKVQVLYGPVNTTEKQLVWTSSDETVATVDQNGYVTMLHVGSVTITAVDNTGQFTDSLILDVQEEVEFVELSERFYVLSLSDSGIMMPVVVGPDTATNKTLIWTSSNEEVAYVNEQGQLIILSEGLVVVRATAENTDIYDEAVISISEIDFDNVRIAEVGNAQSVLGSKAYTFALDDTGTVWYWGDDILMPRKLPYENIIDIDVSYSRVILLSSDNKIYYNRREYYSNFDVISNIPNVIKVAASEGTYFAMTEDGNVWGWGNNHYYILGQSEEGIEYNQPVLIPGVANVVDIFTSESQHGIYFLMNDGFVKYLGYSNSYDAVADYVSGLSNVVKMEKYENSIIAYTNENKMYRVDYYNQTASLLDINVSGITSISFTNNNHKLVLTNTGEVYSWGNNNNGQLGIGTTVSNYGSYTKIPGLNNIIYVNATRYNSYAIDSSGKLYAWGDNANGQIANLSNEDALTPQKIYFGMYADESPINIKETNPSNGELFFNVDGEIVVTFNKAVYKNTQFPYIVLKDANNMLVAFNATLTLNKLIIKPTNALDYEMNYSLVIPSGALKDLFNNSSPTLNMGFKTAPEVPYVYDINLDQTDLTITNANNTYQMQYSLTPAQLVDNTYITWSSSDELVASVDNNGLVTINGLGSVVLTVATNDGRISKNINLTIIEAIPLVDFSFAETSGLSHTGQVYHIDVIYNPVNTTEQDLIWTSSDETKAKVDQKGNVTSLKAGPVTITATTPDGLFSQDFLLTIEEPVTEVKFTKEVFVTSLDVTGDILPLSIYPDSATDKTIIWESSDPDIAYVDENNNLVKLTVGNVKIRATSQALNLSDEILVSINYTKLTAKPIKVVSHTESTRSNFASLVLMDDGTVWTWGSYNDFPVKLETNGILDIESSTNSLIMLKNDSTIYYTNSVTNFSSFNVMNSLENIVEVAVGYDSYFALTSDGNLWGWGNNSAGVISQYNISSYISNPTLIYSGGDLIDIAIKSNSLLMLTSDNRLLFRGSTAESSVYTTIEIEHTLNISKIEMYDYQVFIVYATEGIYYVYFNNLSNFNLIDNLFEESTTSTKIEQAAFSAYNEFGIYLLEDGTVYSDGYNNYGQLGLGYASNSHYDFEEIESLENIVYVNAIRYNGFAISSDGKVYMWGYNRYKNLATYDKIDRHSPVEINLNMYVDSTTPFNIVSQSISNGELNVGVDTTITFEYSMPFIASETIHNSYLKDGDGKFVPIEIKVDLSEIVITPLNSLKYNENYTFYLPDNSLMSYTGLTGTNKYNNSINIQFTTEPQPEVQAIANTYQWTLEDVQTAIQEFMDSGMSSGVYNNAILNNLTDPTTDTWMRFIAYTGTQYKFLTYNWWGTTDAFLIGKQIRDYEDYPDLSKIIYNPYLVEPPVSAYPFVVDAYLSTDLEEKTSIVGIGEQTFTVTFNRDMDVREPLGVYFGPDYPYTDYKVNGDWVDARTWVGTFKITPLTGDGKHFFRIRDGRAADDHWLEIGDDDGRFLFEIITAGAESMNLQANGAEGRIILSWTQDDFDLLAGYDVYRSYTVDGEYTKINQTLIPKDQLEYSDYDVQPGVIYYYKFKVVKTDLTSSDFSNMAASAAFDTIAPTMYHNPVPEVNLGTDLVISVNAYDNIGINSVMVYYRAYGEETYNMVDLVKTTSGLYSTRIYMNDNYADGIEYYIEVKDDISTVYSGSETTPNFVRVKDIPTITSLTPSRGLIDGGQEVVISGANFKEGTLVYFGDQPGMNVTFIDATTIKVTTPMHYPSRVNVSVENPSGDRSVLVNGYEYYSDQAQVQIPTVRGQIDQEILVPINIQNFKGLLSADLKIGYDNSVLQYVGFLAGNVATRFSVVVNSSVAGEVSVAMASDVTITGSGDVLYLKFKVIASPTEPALLEVKSASLNGGNIVATTIDGQFVEDIVYTFSGTIYYYANSQVVQNVQVVLVGENQYIYTTGNDGTFLLQEIQPGSYDLGIEKRDETNAISAFDASMILRYAVGLENLNSNQMIAGDVNNDGSINSFDAAMILQYVAGLRVLPFEGRTEIWYFSNNNASYDNLNQNYINQSITAILIGDVSGNYSQTAISSTKDVIKVDKIVVDELNQIIQVPLSIVSLTENIFAIETDILFDESLVVEEVIFDSALANYFKVVNTNIPGKVRIVVAGVEALSEIDNFVTIKFRADALNGAYTFVLDNTKFNENESIQEIINTLDVEMTLDLNQDGVINDSDIDYLLNYINRTNQEEDISAMDYNHDGIIDIFDLIERQKDEE